MSSSKPGSSAFVVNLRNIMEDYAWRKFLNKKGYPWRLFLQKNDYCFDMRWTFLNFEHETKWTKWEKQNEATKEAKADVKGVDDPIESKDDPSSPTVLHRAEYENRTPMEQRYTFSTTRETSVSDSVEFQSNYSLGAETNIELSLPGDWLTLSAGVNGSYSVTKTEEQSFQETRSWNVDTEITVAAGHKATAHLRVHQSEVEAEFEVKTTMSLGKDWFPILVRKRDNSEIVYTGFATSLKDVFESHSGPNLDVKEVIGADNVVSYNVELLSTGKFQSISWTEQEVVVNSNLLPDLSAELKDMIKAKQYTQM